MADTKGYATRKAWRQTPEGRAEVAAANKISHAARRRQAIEAYGGKCACCGESSLPFLTIEHIGGGGTAHRRKLNGHQETTL